MEPADIDWNKVDSRFVRDDLYEHFDAPKWVDFAGNNDDGDEEAWFCRPDCRHPKTAEDYLRMSSSSTPPTPKVAVLGSLCINNSIANQRRDGNLKRRGVLLPSHLTSSSSSLASSVLRHSPRAKLATSKKKCWDDIENQNPNLNSPSRTHTVNAVVKSVKDTTIKSSAEKPKREEMGELQDQRRHLKSTRSARNLFAGKDILSQISEFCNEIKKLALIGRDRKPPCSDEEGEEKKLEALKEKSRKKLGKDTNSSQCRRPECREGLALLQLDVRSSPPTPQQIPSPMGRCKQAKVSPLKPFEPVAPERGVLRELEKNKDNEYEPPEMEDGCSSFIAPVVGTEAKALDMFWFLKPCTYLGR